MKTGRWLPWLAGTIALTLYGLTAAPSIVEFFDDSLEFQLVGPTFGIAHPTGYPLYVILGGLWSRLLPVGNWAWRMNLFSALAAAGAVALTTYLAQRLNAEAAAKLTWAPGATAALLFGLGPIWWSQATVAEVYALHGLWVAAILVVALQIQPASADTESSIRQHVKRQHVKRQTSIRQTSRRMMLLCLLIGLGLAHHRTTVLLLPGLALYLLLVAPQVWRPQWRWLLWGGVLLTPLLLYLFLPLRAAMGVMDLHGSYVNTWSGFWDHVLARQYTGFFSANPLAVTRRAADWLTLWLQQTGTVGFALGAVGLLALLIAQPWQRRAGLALLVMLLTNLLFAINYRVADVEVFLLPALLIFALLAGNGVALLVHWLGKWPRIAQTVGAICVLLVTAGVSGRGPAVNRSQDWAVHDAAVAMAKVDFPPASQVVALEGEATALHYLKASAGLGRNATPVVADDPALRRQTIAALMARDLPVFLTREVDGIARQYSFSSAGPLVRVWPRGQAQVGEPTYPLDEHFVGGALRLEGYDLARLDQAGDDAWRVAFYWRPAVALTQTLKLSLRLQLPDGSPTHWPGGAPVQQDAFPLHLVAATTDWLPGERIRDDYTLSAPPQAMDKPTQLVAILYDAQTLAEAGRWQVNLNQ